MLDISEEVLQKGAIFLEEVTDKEKDPLKPLRGIQGQVVELSQLLEVYCSLSLWRVVRGIKLTYLASNIHGLFLT